MGLQNTVEILIFTKFPVCNSEVVKCAHVTWPIRHIDAATRTNVIRSAKVVIMKVFNYRCCYEMNEL